MEGAASELARSQFTFGGKTNEDAPKLIFTYENVVMRGKTHEEKALEYFAILETIYAICTTISFLPM